MVYVERRVVGREIVERKVVGREIVERRIVGREIVESGKKRRVEVRYGIWLTSLGGLCLGFMYTAAISDSCPRPLLAPLKQSSFR
jgi:hypothetical protein